MHVMQLLYMEFNCVAIPIKVLKNTYSNILHGKNQQDNTILSDNSLTA